MAADLAGSTQVFLDTCCVLNLYATGRMGEILADLSEHFAVAEAVLHEAMYVREPESPEWQAVDLTDLIATGLLDTVRPDTEKEQELFVSFADPLGDGEAMTCALAVSRGGAVATDDRKAMRLLGSLSPSVEVMTTPFLLKLWASQRRLPQREIRMILENIERKASFRPRAGDPLRAWWESLVI